MFVVWVGVFAWCFPDRVAVRLVMFTKSNAVRATLLARTLVVAAYQLRTAGRASSGTLFVWQSKHEL
jgi:hypothetical protein